MILPRLEPYEDDYTSGWLVRTPYHVGFLGDLRSHVSHRKWLPEIDAWLVATSDLPIVKHLIRKHFGDYTIQHADGVVEIVRADGETFVQGGAA